MLKGLQSARRALRYDISLMDNQLFHRTGVKARDLERLFGRCVRDLNLVEGVLIKESRCG